MAKPKAMFKATIAAMIDIEDARLTPRARAVSCALSLNLLILDGDLRLRCP